MKVLLLTFFTVLLFSINSYAVVTSATTGDWTDPATWDSGVPQCGDTIHILAGHRVDVSGIIDYNSTCGLPMYIEIYGTLNFTGGGSKLRLPGNSGIDIYPGAVVSAPGGGGGNSRTIEIGGNVVWSKSDGNISGPMQYGSPLPVELLSFEAFVVDNEVRFYWSTASELNNEYFIIEYSKYGSEWEEVVRTNGAGTSNQVIDYYESTVPTSTGLCFYRITQIDFNGNTKSYNAVPVDIESNGEPGMSIFPNPVEETMFITFKDLEGSEMLLVLRDITGKEFFTKVKFIESSEELISIDLENNVPSGVYIITAAADNRVYSKKVIIQ